MTTKDIISAATAYYNIKQQIKTINNELERRKKALKTFVEKFGDLDDKHSQVLPLDDPTNPIGTVKNQLNTSITLDEAEAEEILRAKGLWEQATETIELIDQDKVHALFYEKKLSPAEFKRIFKQKTWYSLILLDQNGKQLS
jgi:hypothetical protein